MKNATMNYDAWIGRTAYDRDGDKVGEIDAVYYDDDTEQPEWVTVRTGLFGHKVTFVPIAGSRADGDNVRLAYDKPTIKDAPNCEATGHLSEAEERRLFQHYQFDWDATATTGYGDAERADRGFAVDRDTGRTDDAMTRSEEELRVGKQQQATGRARLRKYVVTEHQEVTVPVTREQVRVEREPITDANIRDATSGPDITESEHEVVTYEERPVVTTEAVPKERVRLTKETVTDQETVEGDVRKERIDVDGAREADQRPPR